MHPSRAELYQPASGVSHGEWWAVEDYAMQRYASSLHFFPMVPALKRFQIQPEFGKVVVNYFERILEVAVSALTERDHPSGSR